MKNRQVSRGWTILLACWTRGLSCGCRCGPGGSRLGDIFAAKQFDDIEIKFGPLLVALVRASHIAHRNLESEISRANADCRAGCERANSAGASHLSPFLFRKTRVRFGLLGHDLLNFVRDR